MISDSITTQFSLMNSMLSVNQFFAAEYYITNEPVFADGFCVTNELVFVNDFLW
jgi:hypothetical protein